MTNDLEKISKIDEIGKNSKFITNTTRWKQAKWRFYSLSLSSNHRGNAWSRNRQYIRPFGYPRGCKEGQIHTRFFVDISLFTFIEKIRLLLFVLFSSLCWWWWSNNLTKRLVSDGRKTVLRSLFPSNIRNAIIESNVW